MSTKPTSAKVELRGPYRTHNEDGLEKPNDAWVYLCRDASAHAYVNINGARYSVSICWRMPPKKRAAGKRKLVVRAK